MSLFLLSACMSYPVAYWCILAFRQLRHASLLSVKEVEIPVPVSHYTTIFIELDAGQRGQSQEFYAYDQVLLPEQRLQKGITVLAPPSLRPAVESHDNDFHPSCQGQPRKANTLAKKQLINMVTTQFNRCWAPPLKIRTPITNISNIVLWRQIYFLTYIFSKQLYLQPVSHWFTS